MAWDQDWKLDQDTVCSRGHRCQAVPTAMEHGVNRHNMALVRVECLSMSERQPEKWHRHDPHGSRDMHMAASQHSGILYGYPPCDDKFRQVQQDVGISREPRVDAE
eukprot:CAMPEP_0181204676 /NCGR_PEP_ID=MMETSP1096-20121128/20065_1 /TAXON_ID=156174 ORGANISM="Chrysochromulina ericina, Strain CCMP281" /NCGR_SAMPLE_ID=MMETSP1096 /ASSEMBLY_ACC=CAM_ASM_000453 /LENGTH=105 /DNA_ID=CAMNT_0023295397 /DNA_START=61 /DNA_END=379 /DNA_ORIENTATION=+